jgi:hypothetical protein
MLVIHRSTVALFAVLGAALCATSCSPPDGPYEITERRVREEPRPQALAPATSDARFGAVRTSPPPTTSGGGIAFELPQGWVERPAVGGRIVSFGVEAKPALDGSIGLLPNEEDREAASVNLLRGKVGLDALDAAAVAELPRLTVMGRAGIWVEARGTFRSAESAADIEDALLVGVIVTLPAVSLAVELVGPYDEVEPELDALRAFAGSLRFGGGTATTSPGDGRVAPSAPAPFTWTTPEGWRESGPRTMRLVTLHPVDDDTTECYVTVLGGDGGGALDNVNRWRGQMALDPVERDALDELPRLNVLGRDVPYLTVEGSFAGMGAGAARADQMLLGVFCELGDRAVSVKMTGPRERVQRERERFEEFCRSLAERRP